MEIIDAHIHIWQGSPELSRIIKESGHDNAVSLLEEKFKKENIVHAVVMGDIYRGMDYPDSMSYCAGIGHNSLDTDMIDKSIEKAEWHLRQKKCVGLKIYAGYTHYDLSDPVYAPFYEMARDHNKPVAVHMGVTAHARALLRYCHPLTMDQVAAEHPDVQFVMCHFGNPWLMDAAAVLEKNDNVTADLSGLIAGALDVENYLIDQRGYVDQLKTWIHYVENYEIFMFGTDWPLTDFGNYIRLFERIIPEKHLENFFYRNAVRIYNLQLPDA